MIVLLIAVLFSLSVSFFCSLMEACLLSLSNSNIAEISQKSPKAAERWKRFKSAIQKPIAVILIINTLAHTMGAAISGAQFDKLFGTGWVWVFSLGYSLVMIQYTEILPKTLGVRFNLAIAGVAAAPLFYFIKIFRPFISFIELANRPFEAKKDEKESISHEITLLAGSAVTEKELTQEQASLISKSVQMSQLKVRDIMVGKDEMECLDVSMSLGDAFLASHIHRHTRYPLTGGADHDEMIGYVNFKDIVTALHVAPEDPSLRGISRPVIFVSETMPLDALMKRMMREYQHIALVRDERGGIAGLVTMEDVLESLVGEIEDEYDRPPEMTVKLTENSWRIGGGVRIRTLKEKIFPELPLSEATIDQVVKEAMRERSPGDRIQFVYFGISIRVRRMLRGYVYDVIAERVSGDRR